MNPQAAGFGQPRSPFGQEDDDTFVIQDKRGRRGVQKASEDDQIIQKETGMFTEKLAAVIGPCYVSAFGLGALYGLTKIPQQRSRRTWRLMLNSYLNSVGKTSSKWANSTAACVFLYLLVGKSVNYVFLEELEEVGQPAQAALFGGLTGLLYKSTRGWRAMGFASALGALTGSTFVYFWTTKYSNKNIEL